MTDPVTTRVPRETGEPMTEADAFLDWIGDWLNEPPEDDDTRSALREWVERIRFEARQQGREGIDVERVEAALRAVDERIAAALRADGYPEHADDLLGPADDKGRRDYAEAIVRALGAAPEEPQ